MTEPRFQKRTLFLIAYLVFAILPIYWMVNMSFKTNEEIVASFSLWPQHFTWDNYRTIFTDPSWYSGYINSLIYVGINMVISLTVALPKPLKSTWARERFIALHMIFVRMIPLAPTREPATISTVFSMTKPAAQPARPE